MVDEKFFVRQRDDFCFLVGQAEIGVTQHDGHRGDEFQFQFNDRVADVAGVKNMVHTCENCLDARIEKPMCIGDNAQFHMSDE